MLPKMPAFMWALLVLLAFSCISCGLQYGLEGSLRAMCRLGPVVLGVGWIYAYWNQKR